jgi:transposase
MLQIDQQPHRIVGTKGSLDVSPDDEITRKLAMLIEGECEPLGPTRAARKYGYTKQRYYQLLAAYRRGGARALQSQKRGPKHNYRRTEPVVRQIIRHRFLDPDATADVLAQKLRQCGCPISTSSVNRVIAEFGLQKKTLRVSAE